MSRARSGAWLVWLRRAAQIACLTLFVWLLLLARPNLSTESTWPVKLFFWIDPLILVATWLTTHAVPAAALAALGTLVVTMVLGRVFCGWVCPLGTIHAFFSWLFRPRRRAPKQHDLWSPWQLAKYYVLAGFLVMALFGGHWVAVWDPLVLLYRTTATALLPAAQWTVEEGSRTVWEADPSVGKFHVKSVTDPPYEFLRDNVFVLQRQAFVGTGLILLVFLVTVALNAYRPRFWCRYVCPLGALLGVFSWRPLLRRAVEPESCNQCDLCGMACHGAAAASPGQQWKAAECLGCFNCDNSCARSALRFRWSWPWSKQPSEERLDVSKRRLLGAAVGGIAGLAMLRATPQGRVQHYNPLLIRPPGAREEGEFLKRCTSCGLCMKVCTTGGLQPAVTEAGLEGLWTPVLVPQIGYCHIECNLCGHVCPTEAIRPLTLDEKKATRIGLATFDTTRCIPYAYGRECMVCEECCPIPDKAIYCVEVEVEGRDGAKTKIKQPRVDPAKCIGCGQCENVCVFRDRPAVRVTSANEARHPARGGNHPGNQPILGDSSPY